MEIKYDSKTEIAITINLTEISRLEQEVLTARLPAAQIQQSPLPQRDVRLILGQVEHGQRYLDMLDAPAPESPEADKHLVVITLSREGYTALQSKGSVRDRVGDMTIGIYSHKGSSNGGTPHPVEPVPFFS